MSGGLDTHFLEIAFGWIFVDSGEVPQSPEFETRAALLRRFWNFEAWCRKGSADKAQDDYKPLSQTFGYSLVEALARLMMRLPADEADVLWARVMALGPRGHYAIGTFLDDWFSQIRAGMDVAAFIARWRAMIERMLGDPRWRAESALVPRQATGEARAGLRGDGASCSSSEPHRGHGGVASALREMGPRSSFR